MKHKQKKPKFNIGDIVIGFIPIDQSTGLDWRTAQIVKCITSMNYAGPVCHYDVYVFGMGKVTRVNEDSLYNAEEHARLIGHYEQQV